MHSPEDEIENPIAEEVPVAAPAAAGNAGPAPGNVGAGTERRLKFGYLFPDIDPFQPSDESLVALGNAMLEGSDLRENPRLPAGYTYLGQFIAHDITFDPNLDIPPKEIDVGKAEQLRTRALDLESLYGTGGPSDRKDLYDDSLTNGHHIYLKVGVTDQKGDRRGQYSFNNDLPRNNSEDPNEATIGDPRNDENLAIAQLHVAFIRFHNAVVKHLSKDKVLNPVDSALFEKARKKVVQHFQWIILHDFLPKIIEKRVLKNALELTIKRLKAKRDEWAMIPVEFSGAAFRLGHSMLRDSYEWNREFQSPSLGSDTEKAGLFHLFAFSGRSGTVGVGGGHLPSEWVIDWSRFFDFTGSDSIANHPKFNWAKRIDTTLTSVLARFHDNPHLSAHITRPEFRSLPVLDLVRGSRLRLPSGQAITARFGLPSLLPSEIMHEPDRPELRHILEKNRFDRDTPLWYYILKEAQVYHDGKRLGPIGSRIVAETIVELLRASPYSILKEPDWKPDLGQRRRGKFGIADLLIFADVVNPLGA